jgi:hypothetical protein
MSIIIPGILNNGQITTVSIDDNAVTQAKLAHDIDVSHLINDAGYKSDLTSFTTDNLTEGSTNQYFTNGRAISAVEGETTLNLQEGLTIDTDIEVGDIQVRDTFAATGIKITNPATKAAWASIVLEEYGGDYADADELPFNIHNPIISGEIHSGTPASPTAVTAFKNCLNILGNARYGTGTGESDTIGSLTITTNENQTSTNRGGKVSINVNPTGGGTDTKEVVKISADTNAKLVFDPNGDFAYTDITSNSTNGFKWNDSNTFVNDVQMNGDLLLPTGDLTCTSGTVSGATVQGNNVNAVSLSGGNITISGDTISTSGDEVEFDADFNVTGTTYFGSGNGTSVSASGEIGTFGSATKVPFGNTIKLDSKSADPTGEAGMMYFNTTTNKFRGYNGTAWVDLG